MSETGWTLRNKGRKAESAGDHAAALAYYEAARQRNNSSDEARDIDADYLRLRQMFDSGNGNLGVDKFKKSDSKQVVLNVDVSDKHKELIKEIFDPGRSDRSQYRETMLPLFLKRSEANANVAKLQTELSTLASGAGPNNPAVQQKKGEIEKAQAELGAANNSVEKKMDEIQQLIIIRK